MHVHNIWVILGVVGAGAAVTVQCAVAPLAWLSFLILIPLSFSRSFLLSSIRFHVRWYSRRWPTDIDFSIESQMRVCVCVPISCRYGYIEFCMISVYIIMCFMHIYDNSSHLQYAMSYEKRSSMEFVYVFVCLSMCPSFGQLIFRGSSFGFN